MVGKVISSLLFGFDMTDAGAAGCIVDTMAMLAARSIANKPTITSEQNAPILCLFMLTVGTCSINQHSTFNSYATFSLQTRNGIA
jgi:hypothetical protein